MILVPNLAQEHIGIEAISSERSGQKIIGVNFTKSTSNTNKETLETVVLHI